MKIYGNDELIKLRAKIDELLKLFASQLETVNNEFTPEFLKLKKRRSNIIYYIVMTIFLFIFISFSVFLNILEALYLILIIYGINLLLTGYGVYLLKRVNKLYFEVKGLWDKKYNEVLKYQKQANSLYELAEVEVYKVMVLTLYHEELEALKENKKIYENFYNEKLKSVKDDVNKNLGSNHNGEDVVAYYIEWGKEITNQDKSNFDYLEARRRKAMLSSKNIDIDNKGE